MVHKLLIAEGASPLGPLPSKWRLVRLRGITTKIGSGATPRGGEDVYLPVREHVALIRSQNVFDRRFDSDGLAFITDRHAAELQSVLVRPGDLLLNITGDGVTFGRSCLAPIDVLPACVNQHVSIIRPDRETLVPGYLLSYLTHPAIKPYIESFNAGGSRRAITKGHIGSFEVPLPPLPEQRAIASILGALDDKIELNRRMNQTLEAMAQALFKSWFVDFDPVRAKATGRQPADMDSETAALFPDSFEGSEFGNIPAGWTLAKAGDVAEFAYGKALKDGVRRPGPVPVYGSNGRVGYHDEALVRGPGIVIGRKGNPGVVTWVPSDFFPIDTTFYVVPRGPIRSMSYLLRALARLGLAALGADSAVPGLNRNMAYMSKMLIPPRALTDALETTVTPLSSKVSEGERESRSLAAIRDALLPTLLSGEIRVREADTAL